MKRRPVYQVFNPDKEHNKTCHTQLEAVRLALSLGVGAIILFEDDNGETQTLIVTDVPIDTNNFRVDF